METVTPAMEVGPKPAVLGSASRQECMRRKPRLWTRAADTGRPPTSLQGWDAAQLPLKGIWEYHVHPRLALYPWDAPKGKSKQWTGEVKQPSIRKCE